MASRRRYYFVRQSSNDRREDFFHACFCKFTSHGRVLDGFFADDEGEFARISFNSAQNLSKFISVNIITPILALADKANVTPSRGLSCHEYTVNLSIISYSGVFSDEEVVIK